MTYLLRILVISILCFPTLVLAREPNDPLYQQWSYKEVQAYSAWDKSIGNKDVIVAIIDNGFDYLHPDLVKNVWKNEDEIADNKKDDDNNGYIDDVWGWNFLAEDRNLDGEIDKQESLGHNDPRPPVIGVNTESPEASVLHHGTVVAGIIGAVGNNSSFGSGLNWQVKLMNIRLLGNEGHGQVSELDRAIRYAVDNGADVINFSIVTTDLTPNAKQAIDYAYSRGVAIVAAAGNDATSLNTTPFYPVCVDEDELTPKVLGVSAIRKDRRIASFSNFGSRCIDITAPGVDIASTLRYAPMHGFASGYSAGWNGTSFAAPFVSATAALIKAVQPTWGAADIYHAILSTTHKTPSSDPEGYADLFGNGLLQMDNAISFAMAQTASTTQPVPKPTPNPTLPVPSATTPPVIQMVSLSQGLIRIKYTKDLAQSSTKLVPELAGMDDVSQYEQQGTYQYVATQFIPQNKQVVVKLFDEAWNKTQEWTVSSEVALQGTMVQLQGSAEQQVVLAPTTASTELFRVYDLRGNGIGTQKIASPHAGVVVSYMRDRGALADDIMLSYRTGTTTAIARYRGIDQEVITFPTEQLTHPGAIMSADINGDGVDEFVVASKKTEAIMVVYYRADGRLLKNFPSYAPQSQVDVSLSMWDYFGDGKEDVVITPKDGAVFMNVWSGQPTLLFQLPIIEKSLTPIRMFVTPE